MTIITERCISDDLFDPEHDRCAGAVFASWLDEGKPCQCPCHALPRCFSPYVADHGTNVFDCKLHIGHGGNFHQSGHVLWGKHENWGLES